MFVGTVVAGTLLLFGGPHGAPARGALLRDVGFYALALLVVVLSLLPGRVTYGHVGTFFALYGKEGPARSPGTPGLLRPAL